MTVSNFWWGRFPFRAPGGPFRSLRVGESYAFALNSLTGSLICETSVSTSHSSLERSACAGFRFLEGPHPIPDPRRAVLEPKCWRILCFRSQFPNQESHLRAVSSYKSHYPRSKCSCRFLIFSRPIPVPDPRLAVSEP